MSNLGEALAAKKALAAPQVCCVEIEYHPVSMVTVCPWQAKEWSLPWARLDSVGFSDEEDSERMELLFPHHHVIAIGENLRSVMDAIRSFKVSRLRDFPASHRVRLRLDAVFISQLEVRLLFEPTQRASTENPF